LCFITGIPTNTCMLSTEDADACKDDCTTKDHAHNNASLLSATTLRRSCSVFSGKMDANAVKTGTNIMNAKSNGTRRFVSTCIGAH